MNNDNIESTRIQGLIPEQLIADSAPLIEFLKEYYNFLNQESNPSNILNTIINNGDLDTAVDQYVELIRKELGPSISNKLEANKTNLYKHIGEFYRAKGSIDAFKLLFRFLFDANIEISLPKEQILIASDGRWSQQNSIFVLGLFGDPFTLSGKTLTIATGSVNVIVEVDRVKRIGQSDNYELFITKKTQSAELPNGTIITLNNTQIQIIESLNLSTKIYGGQNFQVGQIIDIDDGTVSGTRVKVGAVDSNGAIIRLDLLQFGVGYSSDITVRLIPDSELSLGQSPVVITTTPDADQSTYPTHAIFSFANSTLAQYAGSYITNKGFLSDDIYLQDNFFYQQYSYVIKSGQRFEAYSNIVNKTIHPSGMLVFGEFEINNNFDLARAITALNRFYYDRFYDNIQTSDNDLYHLTKPINDTVLTSDDDLYHLTKPLTDELFPFDTPKKTVYKSPSDLVFTTFDVIVSFGKNPIDIVNVSENLVRSSDKVLSDSINITDNGTIEFEPYSIGYFAQDYVEGISIF